MDQVELLSKVFPIQEIDNDCLINGNGDITFGFSLMLPEVYTLTPLDADAMHESFVSLIKLLPVGTLVHKQDFFFITPFKGVLLENEMITKKANYQYFNERPMLRHYSNIYFTLPVSFSSKKEVSATQNSFLKLSDYIFKRPFKDQAKQFEAVSKTITSVTNSLNAIKSLRAKRMDGDALASALYDYLNLSYDKPISDTTNAVVNPWEIHQDYLRIGTQFVQVLSLVGEGSELTSLKTPKTAPADAYGSGVKFSNSIEVPGSMVFPIGLGLPINHILNTSIQVLDFQDIDSKLMMEKYFLNIPAGLGFRQAKDKNEEIQLYLDNVSKADLKPCRTSVNLVLHHNDLTTLNNYVSLAQTAFQNMNDSKAYVENYDNGNLFLASCPGNKTADYRSNLIISTIQHSVCYFHKETCYWSEPKGNLFIDRAGAPVIVNLWDPVFAPINNKNKLIFGPSGSGKSFFINGLIEQSLYQFHHVIGIDIGRSYEKSIKLNGGKYFDAANKESLSFNIFVCPQDSKGNYLYNVSMDGDKEETEYKINFISTVIITLWKQGQVVKIEEKTILKDIIINFYEFVNENKLFPTLIEFDKFLEVYEKKIFDKKRKDYFDFISLRLVLEPYTKGSLVGLLNSKSNIDLVNERFVIFELEAIKENKEVFNLVSVIIIELVLDKCRRLPLSVKKTFLIDEGLDFLKADMAEFIAYLYRTIRKKNGEVYLATQNVNFLESTSVEVRESMLANSDTKILLNHKNYQNLYPGLKKYLSLTDNDIKLMDSLEDGKGYREFFIKMGNLSRVYRYEVSAETAAVYTTAASEVEKIATLFEKTGSMATAIIQYVEDKQIK